MPLTELFDPVLMFLTELVLTVLILLTEFVCNVPILLAKGSVSKTKLLRDLLKVS
jgi:hypothetical protein